MCLLDIKNMMRTTAENCQTFNLLVIIKHSSHLLCCVLVFNWLKELFCPGDHLKWSSAVMTGPNVFKTTFNPLLVMQNGTRSKEQRPMQQYWYFFFCGGEKGNFCKGKVWVSSSDVIAVQVIIYGFPQTWGLPPPSTTCSSDEDEEDHNLSSQCCCSTAVSSLSSSLLSP